MERLEDDILISICHRIHNRHDLISFSEVSKQFLKATCIRRWYLEVSFTGLLNDILPASPNLRSIQCSKPLPNKHMKLLALSCPKLSNLGLDLEKNFEPKVDYESDFDDDGLCAVANACCHLESVSLSRRLHVGDVDLGRCVKVTDESLKAIGEATRLRSLNLQGCYLITDLGLKYFATGDLKNSLTFLFLDECVRISDAGCIYLGQNISLFDIANNCLKLRVLHLTGCEAITGEALHAFADHPTLSYLNLFSCRNISWEEVMSSAFTRLKYLGLSSRMNTPLPKASYKYLDFGDNRCRIYWG
ncbi:Leucine-rich repeat, cysteine-containing subtype [Artemisia annua]|uniref:Leucine-rich repeat, cysteine-containing subtype n=1 Tax=Artemisia annua TaxID=35608 RepID=A0A2U1PUE9_ARTAN|nr:Leucine-rich repeat, cysteine-containing subtype [Artemisia annua]